jgi:hypothetical protein
MLRLGTTSVVIWVFIVSEISPTFLEWALLILESGQHNTAELLPQYCPPFPQCQSARLSGQTCSAQGSLEPVVCTAGYYCPKGGQQQIKCPKGSFCPQGSYQAIKCTAGSRCPEGSTRDMTFLPLGILIIFDAFLITAATVVKIKQRFFRKQKKDKHSFKIPKTGKSLASRLGRNRQYKEIGDPEEAAPFEYDIDYEMEPRSTNLRHRPTGFEQLGAIEDFSHDNHFNKNAEEDRTDLHLFVESLSKCLGNSNFGLSFEFEDLRFQPKKSPKPILSEVSGRINAGSL